MKPGPITPTPHPEENPIPLSLLDGDHAPPLFDEKVRGKVEELLQENLNTARILEVIKDPERAEEYRLFAEKIMRHLDPSEQEAFAQDPIGFTSELMAFRGLTPEKFKDIQAKRRYEVQSGQMGSGTGVFLSNSPYASFTYQNKGTIALFPREKLVHNRPQGFLELGSDEYKLLSDTYVQSIKHLSRAAYLDALYSADDQWDMIEPVKFNNSRERILVLRLDQPITATQVFLTWNKGTIQEHTPEELKLKTDVVD